MKILRRRIKIMDRFDYKLRTTLILLFLFVQLGYSYENLERIFSQEIKNKKDLVEIKCFHDTLLVITTDQTLFYPFGKINEFDKLSSIFSGYKYEKNDDIHLFSKKDNIISFIKNVDISDYFEVVNCDIMADDIFVLSKIKIGITKVDFIKVFFHNEEKLDSSKYSIITFESGLTGIWYHFMFNNSVLIEIRINTDFKL
jgi:hypothetical protein